MRPIAMDHLQAGYDGSITLLQSKETSVRVAMIYKHSLTRDCIIMAIRTLDREISFVSFDTVDDCIACHAPHFNVILYYPHEKASPDGLLGQEITALRRSFAGRPIIILSDATQAMQAAIVRDALRSGASGVISSITNEMATMSAAIRYVLAGGIVVPTDMILAGSAALFDDGETLPEQADLTSRQKTVLAHLRQGKANKIIAQDLHMSESTVKVHVRNIMRKTGATNRTQAVYNAR